MHTTPLSLYFKVTPTYPKIKAKQFTAQKTIQSKKHKIQYFSEYVFAAEKIFPCSYITIISEERIRNVSIP